MTFLVSISKYVKSNLLSFSRSEELAESWLSAPENLHKTTAELNESRTAANCKPTSNVNVTASKVTSQARE